MDNYKYFNYIYILILSIKLLFSQSTIKSNRTALPVYALNQELEFSSLKESSNNDFPSIYHLSFNINYIVNIGHPNIDNTAEIYAPGPLAKSISLRYEYGNKWLQLELEPYMLNHSSIIKNDESLGTYHANNNYNYKNIQNHKNFGFRQSRIIVHYNGLGVGYGNMSHWWGPGFHSALSLSSNSPSQETYAIGTFKDIRWYQFSFGAQIIVMPYTSTLDNKLYFSGLKFHISHHSNSAIITLGGHRTYMSGKIEQSSSSNIKRKNWSIYDAARLVVEPLFGQDKTNLDYTDVGTPGFDPWDEILTGYFKIEFLESKVQIYADIASNDNRGNLLDLKAHWDHTLAYQIGFKKINSLDNFNILLGVEYLTTRISNTFKPDFYRGHEIDNYYASSQYDYFTYNGRRMGAHSGSSSDDLILIVGLSDQKKSAFISFNKERHGIKRFINPEIKSEINLSYSQKLKKKHTVSITYEYEKINNYSFIQNNTSFSTIIWFGYTFIINK
jgi:hypothetical protein